MFKKKKNQTVIDKKSVEKYIPKTKLQMVTRIFPDKEIHGALAQIDIELGVPQIHAFEVSCGMVVSWRIFYISDDVTTV